MHDARNPRLAAARACRVCSLTRSWPQGLSLTVDGTYLGAVLRLGPGDQVKLFDDRSGEWLAEIVEAGKKRVTLTVGERLREREAVPDLWLLFAPIKRGRIDWLVEKATELGVARLMPVITRRTVVDRLNLDRLRAHAIEAAEQCERTALPELAEPQKLDAVLKAWPADRTLYFADEAGGEPFAAARRSRRDPDRPGRRLHRRGARRRPRFAPGPPGLARPPHPARRHRRAGGGLLVDGRGADDWH